MTTADLEARVMTALLNVAPDIRAADVECNVPFRDQFDFDSMDTLNFAIELSRAFDIDVPEVDYRQLASLGSTVAYVKDHLPQPAG
jgi:acyl carrier protein